MKKKLIFIFIFFFKVNSIGIDHSVLINQESLIKISEIVEKLKFLEVKINSDSLEKFEIKIDKDFLEKIKDFEIKLNESSIIELKKIFEKPINFTFGLNSETINFIKFNFKLIFFSVLLYKVVKFYKEEIDKNKLLLYQKHKIM